MRIAPIQAPGTASAGRGARRRGVTSMLAMIFMVLFSTLALGFYATVTTSVAMSRNERQSVESRIATESGVEFMQYRLMQAKIDEAAPADYMDRVYTLLYEEMHGTANLLAPGSTVTIGAGDVVSVPETGYITVDANTGGGFRATLTPLTSDLSKNQRLRAHIIGRSGTEGNRSYRAIDLEFRRRSSTLDYGIATKGAVVTSGSAQLLGVPDGTLADILSASTATPAIHIQSSSVAGELYTVNPSPSAITVKSGTSVAGTTDSTTIQTQLTHEGELAPDFPTVNTSIFIPYATNTLPLVVPATIINTRIPAGRGTALTPLILGNKTIEGVLYIEAPNVVTINGNTTIRGIIVGPNNPTGDVTTNKLTIAGNVQMIGLEALPGSYGDLRLLGGSLILMPKFLVTFSGTIGAAGGTVAAGQFTLTGASDLSLSGNILGLENQPLSLGGSGSLTIKPTTWVGTPSGLTFTNSTKGFVPVFSTFAEVPQ